MDMPMLLKRVSAHHRFPSRMVFRKFVFVIVVPILIIVLIFGSSNESASYSSLPSDLNRHLHHLFRIGGAEGVFVKDLSQSPVPDSKNFFREPSEYNVTSYIGNLDISELKISDYSGVQCEDLIYTSKLASTVSHMPDDRKAIREALLKTKWKDMVAEKIEIKMDPRKVLSERWYKFHASSQWLAKEQVHFVISRVVYITSGNREHPKVSFLYAQTFDRNWKEVKTSIRYVDIDEEGDENPVAPEDDADPEHFAHFPKVLDIPFYFEKDLPSGPEDPRMAIKYGNLVTEPVVTFSMLTQFQGRRSVHAFFPFRKYSNLVKFNIDGEDPKDFEKNWSPFFENEVHDNEHSKGLIHFVYDHNPLTVLKCNLDYGICFKIQSNNEFASEDGAIVSGTNFVPIPAEFKLPNGAQAWVGFARISQFDVGCTQSVERSALYVLISDAPGKYRSDLLSEGLTFDTDATPYEGAGPVCRGAHNVYAVTSVAYWDVIAEDHYGSLTDYMGLLINDAEMFVRRVDLRGTMDYLINMYKEKPVTSALYKDEEKTTKTVKATQCSLSRTKQWAQSYADANPAPEEEPEPEPEILNTKFDEVIQKEKEEAEARAKAELEAQEAEQKNKESSENKEETSENKEESKEENSENREESKEENSENREESKENNSETSENTEEKVENPENSEASKEEDSEGSEGAAKKQEESSESTEENKEESSESTAESKEENTEKSENTDGKTSDEEKPAEGTDSGEKPEDSSENSS